jgi:hypothetical protein
MDQHIRRVMSPNTRFVTHAESPLVERHNA